MTDTTHEIDFDEEKVRLEDGWVDASGLEERIARAFTGKQYVLVGRLGAALEALTNAVAGAQFVTIKITPGQYAELETQSRHSGRTIPQVARERIFRPVTPAVAAPAELSAAAFGLMPKRRDATTPPPALE